MSEEERDAAQRGVRIEDIPVGATGSVDDDITRTLRDLMLRNTRARPDGGNETRLGAAAIVVSVRKHDGPAFVHVRLTHPEMRAHKAELVQGLLDLARELSAELGVQFDFIGIPPGGAAPGTAAS